MFSSVQYFGQLLSYILSRNLFIHFVNCRLAMEVQYAVIFEGDSDAINHATLDLMNLHSNKIEDTSLHYIEDNPTAVYTVSSFRNFILDGLNKRIYTGENTLDFDPDSLQLVNGKKV